MGYTGIQISDYIHEYWLYTNSHKRVRSFAPVSDGTHNKYECSIVLENVEMKANFDFEWNMHKYKNTKVRILNHELFKCFWSGWKCYI